MNRLPPRPTVDLGGVKLRPWLESDAIARVAAGRDERILRYTSVQANATLDDAKAWVENASTDAQKSCNAYFAIADKSTDVCIGSLGLIQISLAHQRGEVGYWILPEFEGKGYGRKCVEWLIDWSFSIGFERLELIVNLDNMRSQRLAERCRFTREGLLRAYCRGRSGREDVYMYGLIRPDRAEADLEKVQ